MKFYKNKKKGSIMWKTTFGPPHPFNSFFDDLPFDADKPNLENGQVILISRKCKVMSKGCSDSWSWMATWEVSPPKQKGDEQWNIRISKNPK